MQLFHTFYRPKSNDDEDFYFTDLDDEDEAIEMDVGTAAIVINPTPTLPPTLSHSDMARPPHEDPEYQRQLVGNIRQGLLMSSAAAAAAAAGNGQTYIKTSSATAANNNNNNNNTVIHSYAWSTTSPVSLSINND